MMPFGRHDDRRTGWLLLVLLGGFMLLSPAMPVCEAGSRYEGRHESAPQEETTSVDLAIHRHVRPQRGDVSGSLRVSDFLLMLARETSGVRRAEFHHCAALSARQHHNGCGAPLRC